MPTQYVTITGMATWADEPEAGKPSQPIYIPGPGVPAHPIELPPLPPEQSGGVPTHPIYIPAPGNPADPAYDIPTTGVERPTHPIALPGQPVRPTHPIYIAGEPTHPIATPPAGGTTLPERDKWQWAWSPYYGWIVLPPDTAARPKKK